MLDLKGVELRPGTIKDPPGPLTVEDYIKARVDDQINYYNNTAIKHQERADFWRFCGLVAASSGAILGTVSALFSLAPWVALLSTVVTSLTAYVKGQQYESMIALYQATASRLTVLKDKWLDSGKSDADTAERNAIYQKLRRHHVFGERRLGGEVGRANACQSSREASGVGRRQT